MENANVFRESGAENSERIVIVLLVHRTMHYDSNMATCIVTMATHHAGAGVGAALELEDARRRARAGAHLGGGR